MKIKKLLVIVLMSAVCLSSLYSCQDELVAIGAPSGSIKVKIDVKEQETRSAGMDGMELKQTMVMGEDSLLLMEYVCDNRSLPFDEVVNSTRSESVTTAGLNKVGGKFGMQAFLDNYDDIDCDDPPTLTDNDHYIVNGCVEYINAATGWSFTNGSGTAIDYKWLNEIFFTFWSYYPKSVLEGSGFGTAGSRHTMTIDDYTVATSSDDQQDLLVAYNNRYSDEDNENDDLNIGFKHILSEIKFDFSAITTKGYTVDKVEIIGAISEGDCVITGGSATKTTEVEDPTSIVWTPDGSKTNTFNMTMSTTITKNNFFMIPQALPSTAKIKITMTKDGNTRTDEKALKNITWLPGKYYEYVLTYDPATYNFKLNTSGDANTTFTDKNTSAPVTKYINLTSTKKKGSAAAEDWDWDIQSYQLGSGAEVPVASTESSITVEDLVISEDLTNKRLTVVSKKWEGIDKGGHKYWTNEDGKSDTDWVPADWSSTYAKTDAPLDLSKFDYVSDSPTTLTSMNTANCYIVRHAGTYMIPLVYGNGVKDGSTNSGAYSGFSGTNALGTFLDHSGSAVSSPFIETNYTASSAAIVWQDRQEDGKGPVIPTSSVKLVGTRTTPCTTGNVRYIQFTVSQSDIRQTNAVIAVKNSSNQTMWSWHIWVTNDPAIQTGSISVTNHTNDAYNFFPSTSLGWIEPKSFEDREDVKIKLVQKSSGNTITVTVKQTKPDKIASSGVVYQWGRKDPFPTGNVTVTKNTGKTSLANAIQYPLTFYASSQSSNWCNSVYTNLWSGKYCGYSEGLSTTASSLTSKTIYDPSPVGYKVPSIFAYSGFSTTGTDPGDNIAATTASPTGYNVPSGTKFDMGWNFNTGVSSGTIFFEATGWSTSGEIESKGQEANYHSALLYKSDNNHTSYWSFGVWDSKLYMHLNQTTYTRLGASVRPVTE